MKYKVEQISKANIRTAISFILPHEYLSINLAQQLRILYNHFNALNPKYIAIPKKTVIISVVDSISNKKKAVVGVLLITKTGELLHHIHKEINTKLLERIAIDFFDSSIKSIIGQKKQTKFFEQILDASFSKKVHRAENYQLMICLEEKKDDFLKVIKQKVGAGVKIIPAQPTDAEKLLPLQLDYENTEVLSNNEKAKPHICLINLKKKLYTEVIYIVTLNNDFIGKAGTNAQGFKWNQIGGVYTSPSMRNKGIATALVAHLVENRKKENKNLALFVKLSNLQAIRTYKKIGFFEKDFFRIAYY